MRKWLGAAAVAAMLAAGAPGSGVASAAGLPGDRAVSPQMDMGATCSPAGTSLAITAEGHKFDKDCLAVPAGESFTIRFDNKDSDRHSVAILPSHTSTEMLFEGDIVLGPKSITYNVPALKAGTFHFHCEVHPNLMNGVFIVAAAAAAPAPAPAPAAKPAPTPAPSMSMGENKPAAKPAPAAPAPKTADAAPAMPGAAMSEPAPKAAAAATPAPARTATGAAAPKTGSGLPRTGPHSARLLVLLSGLLFGAGGLSVLAGARRQEAR